MTDSSPTQERLQALIDVIKWALGESETERFPGLPDDWPRRKFYWRDELRTRFKSALLAGSSPVSEAKTEPEVPRGEQIGEGGHSLETVTGIWTFTRELTERERGALRNYIIKQGGGILCEGEDRR